MKRPSASHWFFYLFVPGLLLSQSLMAHAAPPRPGVPPRPPINNPPGQPMPNAPVNNQNNPR